MLSSKLTHHLPDQIATSSHTARHHLVVPQKQHRTRCWAADRPGEHDAAKGIQHDEQAPTAAAAAAAAGQGPSADSSKPGAARVSEDVIEIDCEAAAEQQQPAAKAAVDSEDDDEDEGPANLDELMAALECKLALGDDFSKDLPRRLKREPVLDSLDLQGMANLVQSGKAKRIIVMCGAGVSVSAGIPDFRTPGTGLYSQLERFGLPEPEAVFSIGFFKKNPKPFHLLAKELFPGNYQPTPTHHFIKLLHDKGLLLRCFTQNIDSLEHQAGLPQQAVVAAHGNFDSAHCIKCGKEHNLEYVKQAVFSDSICHCTKCGAYVKPDIVFFGEQLPDRFYERMEYDFPTCDLLLVMGTSLVVHPFASLIDAVPDHCPRVLLNRERVGEGMGNGLMASLLGFSSGGFIFEGSEGAYRDVLYLGDTDDGVKQLAELLGWGKDLEALIEAGGISGPAGRSEPKASGSSSSSSSKPDGAGVESKQDSSQPRASAEANMQGSSSKAGKADKGSADAAAGEGDSKASAGKNSSKAATSAASDAASEGSKGVKGAVPQSKV